MTLSESSRKCSLIMGIATGVVFLTYIVLRAFVSLQCPNPSLKDPYDADKYLGIWYELRRDTRIPFETGECVTAQYSKNSDGSIKVDN